MVYEFISSCPNGRIGDEETRKSVRKNAMKAYRRNERLSRIQMFQGTQPYSNRIHLDRHQNGDAGPDRKEEENQERAVTDTGCREMLWELTSMKSLGSAIDPFCSTVLPRHHQAPQLFSHFVYVTAQKLQPVGYDLVTVFAREALADPLLLSATLFHAGLHTDAISGSLWSPNTLYYRGEALRSLNQRLQCPRTAICDSTLAAVGYLAATSDVTGEQTGDETHLKALQTMVKMRGGLSQLGWNGALATFLSIGDVLNAAMTGSQPNLGHPDITTHNVLLVDTPPRLLEPPATVQDPTTFCQEIRILLFDIKPLFALRSKVQKRAPQLPSSITSFMQLCAAIEYRLVSTHIPDQPESDPEVLIHDACRIVLLSLMSFNFRAFQHPSAVYIRLEQQLRRVIAALEKRSQPIEDQSLKKMLLWILWVGIITSPNLEWFLVRIRTLTVDLGFVEWDRLKSCLEEFVWTEKMNGKAVSGLWERVRDSIVVSSKQVEAFL
ncbi:uncharacterized protein BDR25DRAFT_339005 [Lindgomyces ingoldianus]|uniref:Uncharacterized protein n=1 Tax=Lindgomyces ingoldianus TaxID=673940 RepID=A0ACB6RC74_9PLEO|nr:uncharacterized protein BDR25DRAFT_339005 [Lindgomyces ingoldianus]KAF2476893.1 hypothetical protein BDR25DRAFT_339005 [Lindgomyces ingoldianus]